VIRQERNLMRAARAIPRPMPWEWARTRLMPLLTGPYLGPDEIVTSVSSLGWVIYGIEVKETFVILDVPVVERWECSLAQIEQVAGANLSERASHLSPADVRRGVLSGRITNLLDSVPWASSLLLAPEHLMRVFGREDQLFGAPKRDALLGFSIDTPHRQIADIVIDFEANAAYPLWLDPFGLINGELVWEGQIHDTVSDDA
jgi:hypothetical protein